MESEEYRKRGKELVDYICQYLSTVRERRVNPDVQPGYMRALLPDSAPVESESWDNIFRDIEKIIMPGVVHWQSPHMHAYFPALTSWPSLLGDMLADAINCLGFTWASSPACTELEMNVMDWLAKMLGLPCHFLHHHPESKGGGVLQSTVSESTLIALLAARKDKILAMKTSEPDSDDSSLNSRLIAYASNQAHSSVEKAGLISLVKVRFLPVDENFSLRGDTLKAAVEEDRKRGLVPVFVCATLGTTGVCAFDNLAELGPICAKEGLWLHIDAAYAGTAFLCPEFRTLFTGVEYADSFTFNPSKWMMVHFDCTAFWTQVKLNTMVKTISSLLHHLFCSGTGITCDDIMMPASAKSALNNIYHQEEGLVKDKYKLQQTFSVNPIYLRHANTGAATDFMHWQIPLSRRFRSLKLWFVIRSFGINNLQAHIRHGTELAKYFESLVKSDQLFEVPAKRHLGLVVFRLKGPNILTEQVLAELTRSGNMFLVPATIHDKFIIRFTVTSQFTTREDIQRDWNLIREAAINVTNLHHSSISNDCNKLMNHQTVEGEGDNIQKITVQPKHADFSPKDWVEEIYEDDLDPFDDCFPENMSVASKHRRGSSIHRYWSTQDKRKNARSLSCNSVPAHNREAIVEKLVPQFELQKDGSILSKLPGKVMILEKNAFRRLIKFYSVPSFPEISIQCGLKLPCCPLQALV